MNLCDVSKKKSSMYRLPNALIPIDLLDYSIYIKEWKLWNLAINFYNINQNYGVKLFSNACMSKLYTFSLSVSSPSLFKKNNKKLS